MIIDNRTMWSSLKTRNVTVSVRPVQEISYIFRVARLVQMGAGREMAFLSALDLTLDLEEGLECDMAPSLFDRAPLLKNHNPTLSLPQKCNNLNFIYTGANMTPVADVHATISAHDTRCRTKLGSISTDVIAPGDYVVFKPKSCNKKARLAQALRLVAN